MRVSNFKTKRLRFRHQYKRMAYGSKRCVGKAVVVSLKPNKREDLRLGITVTRRFGKAHERNRFKRQVREAFRLCYPKLKKGYDLNIKPKKEAGRFKMQLIKKDFLEILKDEI